MPDFYNVDICQKKEIFDDDTYNDDSNDDNDDNNGNNGNNGNKTGCINLETSNCITFIISWLLCSNI